MFVPVLRAVAQCTPTMGDEASLIATADEHLYVVNKSSSAVQIGPGELFGFGLGVYEEKALGT